MKCGVVISVGASDLVILTSSFGYDLCIALPARPCPALPFPGRAVAVRWQLRLAGSGRIYKQRILDTRLPCSEFSGVVGDWRPCLTVMYQLLQLSLGPVETTALYPLAALSSPERDTKLSTRARFFLAE